MEVAPAVRVLTIVGNPERKKELAWSKEQNNFLNNKTELEV